MNNYTSMTQDCSWHHSADVTMAPEREVSGGSADVRIFHLVAFGYATRSQDSVTSISPALADWTLPAQ